MADVTITIDHVESHVDEIIKEINEKTKKALSLMGETVEKYAKSDCPVDTGRLRNSLMHEAGDYDGDPCEYVGSDVEYSPYVEFIDRYHHPVGKAHFLRDGAQNHIDELKEVATAALGS